MSASSKSLLEKDPLPGLIAEKALYPLEKWAEKTIGKGEGVHGTNEILWEIHQELDPGRWLKEMTVHLFCRTERIRGALRAGGAAISEFAYIPTPGLKNGARIQHPCEIGNRLKIRSVLSEAPNLRSRELAWLIPYRTSVRETNLIFILTFDPIMEMMVRTINKEWEACIAYWRDAASKQGLLASGIQTTCLHAFTGLHEWMEIVKTSDGEDTPPFWKRHAISLDETSHAANAGLDIYYSNSVLAYAWSTLEKQKGRERARATLQQSLCKRVILFDPIYGKNQGTTVETETVAPDFLEGGDTENERTAKSFWEGTACTAHERNASDIHIEPVQVAGRKGCDLIVSLRKDGQLNFHTRIPGELAQEFVRFALETSGIIREENRVPQDGRRGWINPRNGLAIDMRISVTPVGAPIQKIVMRLLDTSKLKNGIPDLGLEPAEVKIWDKALKLNQSLVLVSGPTNSGKCQVGSTKIRTNKGILQLKTIVEKHERGERFLTWNETGWEPITKVFRCGVKEVVKVKTNNGTCLKTAETHPFLSCGPQLQQVWRKTKQLQPGDKLLFLGSTQFSKTGDWNKFYLYGTWCGNPPKTDIQNKHAKYIDHIERLLKAQTRKLDIPKGGKRDLARIFLSSSNPHTKKKRSVPAALWTTSSYELAGFFSGWIDANSICTKNKVKLITKNHELANDGKFLLTTLGIQSSISKKRVKGKRKWVITIKGNRNLNKLIIAGINPITTHKTEGFSDKKEHKKRGIKFSIGRRELSKLQSQIVRAVQKAYGKGKLSTKNWKKDLKLEWCSKKCVGIHNFQNIFDTFPKALDHVPHLGYLIQNEIEPEVVKSITYTGRHEEMFDIEVGRNHTYTTEGLICHNSTTLYASLISIFDRDNRRSIATIEDPVEYRLPFRATQSPVNEDKGTTYERLIRQAMRNDGDTFLVGEIRDGPTASAAIQLALTGHQVLSSIHANSATETALRMLELGVDPHLLSETLRLIVAQRLVPTPCPLCAREIKGSDIKTLLRRHGGEIRLETCGPKWERHYRKKAKWLEGDGCTSCSFTGIQGMMAAQEFLVIDTKNKKALKDGNMESLAGSMIERSLPTIEESVWRMAWLGKVSMSQAGELTDQLKNY